VCLLFQHLNTDQHRAAAAMVKKKGKSKRTTLKDKYRIQRRIVETHRKRKKQAKKDAASGKVQHKTKDPGIPNSWPFKQDLLRDIQRTRDREQAQEQETKEKRKSELRALREHQAAGGSARTVEELMQRAMGDQQAFEAKQEQKQQQQTEASFAKSDGSVSVGQSSRRAYLRELKKVVDAADVILQVLDARDPVQSRIHQAVEDAVLSHAGKRMVLVLNKIDLVPAEVVGSWLTVLRRSHPTIAMAASSQNHEIATQATVDALLQLLKNYARNGKNSKTCIVVGVIGYPNTGKSGIINALKRSRAVGVSPKPGFTTSLQEVVLDRNVRLLDSPGIVFDDQSALLGNCVDSESIADPIPPITALVRRCDAARLMMTYSIPNFNNDTMVFLAMVAKSYGKVLPGGIPDKVAAARCVLRDWNTGKIPYYTVPPVEQATQSVTHNDAVIVSGFGKELDLSELDAVVMQSLEKQRSTKDEIDYVPMRQDEDEMEMQFDKNVSIAAYREAATFLAGDMELDGDDNDDDDDEAASEPATRDSHLANADDYDFDDM